MSILCSFNVNIVFLQNSFETLGLAFGRRGSVSHLFKLLLNHITYINRI